MSIDDCVAITPHDCNAANTSTLVNNTHTARVLTNENTGNTPEGRKHKKTGLVRGLVRGGNVYVVASRGVIVNISDVSSSTRAS